MAHHKLANKSELFDGYIKSFEIEGNKILLIQQAGKQYVIENKCGHFGVPLEKGLLKEKTITCKQHGIEFDLATGAIIDALWDDCDPVKIFTLLDENGVLGVTV